MKILVLSDSHSSLGFMRMCVAQIHPDVIVHLGDHYEDGAVLAEEYPHIRIYQVPGNCDRFLAAGWQPEILCCTLGGVMCYMTHGHKHSVKSGESRLLAAAKEAGARVVMYGHTHEPVCKYEGGLLVLNPGSCRGYGGSVALLEIQNNAISSCRVLWQEDIAELSRQSQEEQQTSR